MSRAPTRLDSHALVVYPPHKSPALRRKMSPHRRDRDHEGPGEARQYSAGVWPGRGGRSGVQSRLEGPRDTSRILDLRIVAEVLESGDRRARPEGEDRVENRLGGD